MKTTAKLLAGLVLAWGVVAQGADKPSVTPEMDAALTQAASSDSAERQKGEAAVRRLFAAQVAAFAKVEGPEPADRIAATLERHLAITTYARDVLTLPADARKAAVEWAFQGEHLQAVASAYARDAIERARGADQIADLTGAEADRILAKLIGDPDWIAASQAVETCRGRAASPEVIDALWDRAIVGNVNARKRATAAPKPIEFRGKKLPGTYSGAVYQYMQPDPDAADVLVALRSQLVEARAVEFLKQALGKPGSTEAATFSQMYNPGTANLYTILDAYKPKGAVPHLLQALDAKETNPTRVRNPNMGFFISGRTPVLVLLIQISGQQPSDFELKRRNDFSGMWVANSEKEHRDAEERIKAWYAERKKEYPVKEIAPATQPGTQPGTQPATGPATSTAPATQPATRPARRKPATVPAGEELPQPILPPQRRQPLIITPD